MVAGRSALLQALGAKTVAEAKRDEVPLPEKVVVDRHLPTGVVIYAYTDDQLREYGRQRVQAERERCARVVEQFPHWLGNQGRAEIAAAIRSQNLIKE